jgi:amino acid permease
VEPDQDAFVKASDYDLASQRHNHRVFVGRLHRSPWSAVTLAALFVALSVLQLATSRERPFFAWLLAASGFGLAAYFLLIALRARRDQGRR